MAESFITTALLGEQSDVVAILRTSLAGDGDDSGRERLSEALQALAEDPRFKRVLAAVQEKVDEAFTTSGRKRTGQASPWAQVRGQRVAAEAHERDVRQQLEESESARLRTEGLHEQLLAAESREAGRGPRSRRARIRSRPTQGARRGRGRPSLPPRPSAAVFRGCSTVATGTSPPWPLAPNGPPSSRRRVPKRRLQPRA